jgi:hypothetical protein
MSHGKPRDPRKEQQWRRWILQWRHSGLSIRDFCARHQLSQANFYAWRHQIQRRDAAAGNVVPVELVSDVRAELASSVSTLEVVLAGGRLLRVAPGFDPTTLRQLLAVLEEGSSC